MNWMRMKYAKPSTCAFFTSQKTRSASSSVAAAGMAYEPTERRARSGACALTSVATSEGSRYAPGEVEPPPVCVQLWSALPADEVRSGDERLDRNELLPGLLVDRDRRQVRVAGRVDRERAEDAVRDRHAEDRLRRLRAVTTAGCHGPQHDVHRLCAVGGVRVRRRADLLAEALHERCALARQALRRLAGDADVRAVGDCAVCVRVAEAVRHLQLQTRIRSLQVLHQLRAVVARDAAREHSLCTGLLDQVAERLVAGLLRVPALEAHDLDAELLRGVLVRRRNAEAVRLLVVQDVHLLVAERLRPHRVSGTLEVVGCDDAGVVALTRRVVLARLARIPLLREAGVRVRRADHRERTRIRPVEDRDDDLRAAGVERSDDADHRPVARVQTRVRRTLGRVPTAGLRGRVVTRLVADLQVAGLPAAVGEIPKDSPGDLHRLLADRT